MLGYLITGCATLESPVICPTKNRAMPKTLYHEPVRAVTPSRSRGAILRPSFASRCPSLKRGRRECRVHAAPAVSCAKSVHYGAHEHTGSAETARLSPRNGFTAYFVLSPVERACCHRHP